MRKKARISKAKRFAIFAREKLIENILAKDKTLDMQLAEEIAYTWFNRFSAIRYMEVNGYLDDTEPVFSLEKGEMAFKNRILVICHRLAKILPEVFEDKLDIIEDFFPDGGDTLESIVGRMMTDIEEDQWHDSVETIGWLYQYYNDQRKKEVFKTVKNNKRIKKEDLPVATQLFTPEWLIEYMVENSLGRLWIENLKIDENKNREKIQQLKESWKFYIPGEKVAKEPISLLDIKIIDPCVGSGHILSYVFDVLMEIYLQEGYTKEEAAQLIVKNNIYGLEIDRRATQMAYFTIMMKGLKYHLNFLKTPVKPHIYELESNEILMEAIKGSSREDQQLVMDIKEYGSLLQTEKLSGKIQNQLKQIPWGQVLMGKYQVVITNPPYMTMYNMSEKMVEYAKKMYPDSKHDLFSAFMEKCNSMVVDGGYRAMVTQHSWMFLSVYKELRKKVLSEKILSLLHLGTRGFEDILGDIVQTVAFVTEKTPYEPETLGCYKRLVDGNSEDEKIQEFFHGENTYWVEQNNFKDLPGWTLTYWKGTEFFHAFKEKTLQEYYLTKKGMFTGNNEYFLKKWYEVPREKLGTDFKTYNKGGRYRKWYGCNDTVVKWHNNGQEIKAYDGAGNINENWFYKTCLTWNLVSASPFCCRIVEKGAVMGDAGPICVIHQDDPNYYYLLGYLNSMVAREFLNALNPTMNYPSGVVGSLPMRFLASNEPNDHILDTINSLVKENIQISKLDWNNYETSMGFTEHPLVKYIREIDIPSVDGSVLELSYEKYKKDANDRFAKLKENEEKLNEIFIKIYGLENHVDPRENDRDLTLTYVCDYKEEISDSLKGYRYVKYMEDIVVDFLSYIVGCLMGRYEFYQGEKVQPVENHFLYICDNEDENTHWDILKDLASQMVIAIKNIFGEKHLAQELEFIKKALGAGPGKDPEKVLRKYFKKYFYRDHLKTYGRRPIYWQLDSGKAGGFRGLVYYHEIDDSTVETIYNDYLLPKDNLVQQEIIEIEHLLKTTQVKIMRKRTLEKRLKELQLQKDELKIFKDNLIELMETTVDRDQGVLENYKKFSKVLAKN